MMFESNDHGLSLLASRAFESPYIMVGWIIYEDALPRLWQPAIGRLYKREPSRPAALAWHVIDSLEPR